MHDLLWVPRVHIFSQSVKSKPWHYITMYRMCLSGPTKSLCGTLGPKGLDRSGCISTGKIFGHSRQSSQQRVRSNVFPWLVVEIDHAITWFAFSNSIILLWSLVFETLWPNKSRLALWSTYLDTSFLRYLEITDLFFSVYLWSSSASAQSVLWHLFQ